MPDGFDLNPDPLAEPLDLGGFVPPAPGPQQAAPPNQPRHKAADFIRLAALIPLALKAGPGGIEGLLQGWQQAQAKKQQLSLQQQQFGRLTAQDAATADYRTKTLQGQEQARRQQFLNQFTQAVGGLDDPAAVNALKTLYASQAKTLGIDPAALDTYVTTAQPPSTIQKRAAEKAVNRLKSQFGEKWLEQGPRFQHMVGGEQVSFDELLRRAGMAPDPNAPPPEAPDLSKSGIDVQAAAALKRGDTAEYERLKKVADEMSGARRADQNPVLEELQRLRLDQARTAAASLPPRVQQAVTSQAKGWDSLPIVKNVQKQAEAVSFTDEMRKDPGNPANDIGLLYAFAKAMDPDSVVREGEYATVQKYAQSWADTFKFNAQRIFGNVPFLSDEARSNMSRTIRAKYQVGRRQYDNVRRSYAAKINKLTGGQDGEGYLTDYAGGFPADATTRAPLPAPPEGNPFRRPNATGR